ncbi:DUF4249 domain-containing protein [Spirosoma montaniterrae]|uniref:DUF4249 domain-containing protein n=1 Tax=Spirosoma montaniterrae TaxID=1178516 RepID=A0A1P9WW12_9BACT|nr:DUF4249 domain-containing protein [Spirosoma montaniterrae]AQG79520.1 hypothetical protein AWR27_09420 [Spirosoma montaniterrae]
MNFRITILLSVILLLFIAVACVDPYQPDFKATVDVVVVDGTINNLPEPQVIQLNRSRADPVTGRFGVLPIRNAKVDIIVNGDQTLSLVETQNGTYQLPSDFKGKVGASYQLRFTLDDGTRYESTPEVMPAVVPISRLSHRFNANSLPAKRPDGQPSRVRDATDIFVDWQDPPSTVNYYRWNWILWERQAWCRSCGNGYYLIWNRNNTNLLYEDCYTLQNTGSVSGPSPPYFINDYRCRTPCWEILYGYDINLFDDAFSNGGQLTGRLVARIPFYQSEGCLVEIRQASLTRQAHRYFQQLQQQTQNSGGLADTPPAAPIGNIRNKTNQAEAVVGYFTAAGISAQRYWLDRLDATGNPPGLFQALNNLEPSPEDILVDPNNDRGKPAPDFVGGTKNQSRPPTAVCEPSDSRTPFMPAGWRE